MTSDADAADLAASLDELEEAQTGLRDIIQSGRDGWRNELARKRRVMATLVAQVAKHLDAFERGDGKDMVTLDIRKGLSAFRAALSMHQASYPAVMIEPGSDEYRASAIIFVPRAWNFAASRAGHSISNDHNGIQGE